MMTVILMSSENILHSVSGRARTLRLAGAMTQAELAARAGVSLASLRRFERTGDGSFELVAKVALALRAEDAFSALFQAPAATSLDEAMHRQAPARQRGRRKRNEKTS